MTAPRRGRRGTRRAKRARLLAGFLGTPLLTLGLWIGAPTPASAILGECSGLDASCLTQSIRDDAVETTRAARDAARDVGDEVQDNVEATIDAAGRILGAAGSPGIPTPGRDDGPGAGNGGGRPHDGGNDPGNRPSGRSRHDVEGAPRAVVVPSRPPIVRSSSSISLAEAPVPSAAAGTDGGLGVGRNAADIGRRVALPLAFLLAMVLAFVAMQGRLDRADPKLHLASLDEDISRFR